MLISLDAAIHLALGRKRFLSFGLTFTAAHDVIDQLVDYVDRLFSSPPIALDIARRHRRWSSPALEIDRFGPLSIPLVVETQIRVHPCERARRTPLIRPWGRTATGRIASSRLIDLLPCCDRRKMRFLFSSVVTSALALHFSFENFFTSLNRPHPADPYSTPLPASQDV